MLVDIIKDLERNYKKKFTLEELRIIYYVFLQGKKYGRLEQSLEIMKVLQKEKNK